MIFLLRKKAAQKIAFGQLDRRHSYKRKMRVA
jgi:hypothetical protein